MRSPISYAYAFIYLTFDTSLVVIGSFATEGLSAEVAFRE